ncbi:hypothetical protein [Pseudomonas sp. RGM2987]|uniref:hypothetical protein n=1 Tax=Pseudomonas sp. RGM2987 TaxID=2930090 RepID=UPI001FD661E2|nr:hypothetical protein [Pseudomonas sp. RGM2987]MCJ8203090.1 hypothetical protein [Pseudomonas sp. RGM2987]
MTADSPVPSDDETPEYPLPSPTNPLSRDQLPDDEAVTQQEPGEDEDVEAAPDDPDIAGDDASGTPS